MFKRVILLCVIINLSACQMPKNNSAKTTSNIKIIEPVTAEVNVDDYSQVIYVSAAFEKSGSGTKQMPFQTISKGLEAADKKNKTAILVAKGIYEEGNLKVKNSTEIFGGYSEKFKERNIRKNITAISGTGKYRIMILGNNTLIDGFTIMHGQVRGKGAAIFTTAKNVKITNNIFARNKTLKPVPWNPKFWHETANDGGAIYCGDGAEVDIENNLFINNKTENGRGGAVAADNKCSLVIKRNLFFKNIAGLDDPMRSSDGGAISIFRWSNADIENNIVLSNTALTHNDAGGIWVALWSSAKIKNNILVDNKAGDDAGAIFIGGQEHRYDAPLDPIPPKDKFFVSIDRNTIIGNRNSSMNSGAMRFTMESRGEFINNITAFNNGIYFQRSEVLISGNTILDNFLLVETKEGLNLCTVKDNIIWANFNQQIDAEVDNNNMKFPPGKSSNYSMQPRFENDRLELDVLSANYFPKQSITKFTISVLKLKMNELTNRIVKIGSNWSIVKSNDENSITLWGNFAGEVSVTVLPTYKVVK